MQFVFNNLNWMSFNVALSLIPLFLTIILQKKHKKAPTFFLLFAWFLFLPNTIYLITDLQYLPKQIIEAGLFEKVFLVFEYAFLSLFGIFTYLVSLTPVKIIIKKLQVKKSDRNMYYLFFHFIVAFGVVLGKTQRTHSIYVLTDTLRVVRDVKNVLYSPILLIWVLLFGIIISSIFFIFKKYAFRSVSHT